MLVVLSDIFGFCATVSLTFTGGFSKLVVLVDNPFAGDAGVNHLACQVVTCCFLFVYYQSLLFSAWFEATTLLLFLL